MKFNRRGILGMIGAGAVAPVAGKVADGLAAQGRVAAVGASSQVLGLGGYFGDGVGMPASSGPEHAARTIFESAEGAATRQRLYRVDGVLDADIASFRLPLTTKVRMQRARDDAARSIVAALYEKWRSIR